MVNISLDNKGETIIVTSKELKKLYDEIKELKSELKNIKNEYLDFKNQMMIYHQHYQEFQIDIEYKLAKLTGVVKEVLRNDS